MYIYFVRHGEGMDDVYNEFGGWSDKELSPRGVNRAFSLSKELKKTEKKIGQFSIILNSPLKRATQTAQIIANELKIRNIELPYLKERNTYGLLSGVKKELAKEEYPKMLESFAEGRYIPASERYKDFVERVGILLENLKKQKFENIICVTHGHLITVVLEEYLGLLRKKIYQECILGVKIDEKGNMELADTIRITFVKQDGKETGKVKTTKFKED